MIKKNITILFLVFIIASILRFYNLSQTPPGVNRDEASIGYTAYSLLISGKDEYGRLLPISFQSFGDWKLPLYIYTTVPFVAILGLSELAVRFPSAIFGIVTVILTYILILELFKNEKLALLTSFLVAISPWHLHLSRVESESNTAAMFIVTAVLFFLKSKKRRHWLLVPSAVAFSLTYYTYAGNHIFTTLLIFGIILIYKNSLARTKWLAISIMIFLALSGFIFYQTIFEASTTKLSGINIFSDPSVVYNEVDLRRSEHENPQLLIARGLHNKAIFALERIGQNYLNAFSPDFLFIKGGNNNAHNISHFGNMYMIEAPFLLLGLAYLLILKQNKRERNLVLIWFFIAPIAASITKDAPHTNRMFAIFPILPLVTACGIYVCFEWIKTNVAKNVIQKSIYFFIALLFMANFLIYMERYHVHFPKTEGENWGIGYKKLVSFLSQDRFSNKRIIMVNGEQSPYIFLLFYQSYDPFHYQKIVKRYLPTSDGFINVKSFDRYEFPKQIDWPQTLLMQNVLIIAPPNYIPQSIKDNARRYNRFVINLSDGEPMFVIMETKKLIEQDL